MPVSERMWGFESPLAHTCDVASHPLAHTPSDTTKTPGQKAPLGWQGKQLATISYASCSLSVETAA